MNPDHAAQPVLSLYRGSGMPMHFSVKCTSCGVSPIAGTRLTCVMCKNRAHSVDYCHHCVNRMGGRIVGHDPTHIFLVCPTPLMDSPTRPLIPLAVSLYSASTRWGYRFRVLPVFDDAFAVGIARRKRTMLVDAVTRSHELFTDPEMDAQLVAYACERATAADATPEQLSSWDVVPGDRRASADNELLESAQTAVEPAEDLAAARRDFAARCPLVAHLDPSAVRFRYALLATFNEWMAAAIKLVDTYAVDHPWTRGNTLGRLRAVLWHDTKRTLLRTTVEFTDTGHSALTVVLDRHRAADPKAARDTLFVQAFRQIGRYTASLFRRSDQAFMVKLKAEGAEDAGGPYRECISQMAAELHAGGSSPLCLFLACPNAQSNVGVNRDRFLPNPLARSPEDLLMFEFIGRLMGCAMRTSNPFVLSLPSLVWKVLVGEPRTRADLEDVDKQLCQSLDFIEQIEAAGVTDEAAFAETIEQSFVVTTVDRREVELFPGGAQQSVTFANHASFLRHVEWFRLHEMDEQIAAMHRGLASVIPQRVLPLLTWQDLELAVCGRPDFDVAFLRSQTTYHGVDECDAHVQSFWRVIEAFTPAQRQSFLRFCWGRTRLPTGAAELAQVTDAGFQLHEHTASATADVDPDQYLPCAHTCFFSVEIPAYSSDAVMRSKIEYAMTHCRESDTDFRLNDQGFAEME